ncbi:MAG: ABC transporter ATP-binding protein [Clostridia bacterium]|nr:ABC transporter ATP-binding protein [Clostridia bacterium]MCR5695019.1 ABC transporter ATP-binding protein/permease [Clostridia bacterium]
MFDEKDRLKGDKKIPFGQFVKRVAGYLKPELGRFILAGILILINVGLDVVLPLITAKVTDNLSSDTPVLSYVIIMAVVYLIICVVNNIFLYFEQMILQKAGQEIIYNLRVEVFSHIEGMSLSQFNEMPVGSLVTRVTSYTQSMSDMFTNVIVNVIRNLLTVVSVYVIMFFISVKLAAMLLISVALIFVSSLIFSKYVSGAFKKERQAVSDLNAFMNETLSGMKTIKLFNRQKGKLSEFDDKNDTMRKARFNVIKGFGIYRPFVTLVYISTMALIFWFGIKMGLSPGSIVAFYLYTGRFFNPVQQLADQLNSIQKARSASERLFNLLDVEPEVRDTPDAVELTDVKGRIEFKNVWFAYEGEHWILKDVSFVIEPGQTCAFVGATGAGKTTILGLIVRNYEIQKGQILIDGIDISRIKIKSLRKAIGQMLQDVFLFSGTVRSNITLHDETIPDEDVKAACRYVNADTFIEKLPEKYDDAVANRGENFSQGQRQLLSFARTVLHKPSILILDEATANIDTETESLIQESLEKMRSIGTMLIVAHRLSTIQHSDQIIVLQNGEVIERGTHQELLSEHGYYWKLYKLQFEQ